MWKEGSLAVTAYVRSWWVPSRGNWRRRQRKTVANSLCCPSGSCGYANKGRGRRCSFVARWVVGGSFRKAAGKLGSANVVGWAWIPDRNARACAVEITRQDRAKSRVADGRKSREEEEYE